MLPDSPNSEAIEVLCFKYRLSAAGCCFQSAVCLGAGTVLAASRCSGSWVLVPLHGVAVKGWSWGCEMSMATVWGSVGPHYMHAVSKRECVWLLPSSNKVAKSTQTRSTVMSTEDRLKAFKVQELDTYIHLLWKLT